MLKIKNKSKKARKTGAGTEVYAFGRGRIHFIEKGTAFGSEQAGYRPAIIVSSDEQNRSSTEVEVVYLTTKKKHPMPTHVRIDSALNRSIALCEQIQTVDKRRFKEYLGNATEKEMKMLNQALAVSMDLTGAEYGRMADEMEIGVFYRGQLYRTGNSGTGRPVVIVSNNTGNLFSTIVEVVPLIPRRGQESPSQTAVSLPGGSFAAQCGKIQTMDKERLTEYIGAASIDEMKGIDQAMAVGLGLIREKKDNLPVRKAVQAEDKLKEMPGKMLKKECGMPA